MDTCNCMWSPISVTCSEANLMATMDSGSVAMAASSIITWTGAMFCVTRELLASLQVHNTRKISIISAYKLNNKKHICSYSYLATVMMCLGIVF